MNNLGPFASTPGIVERATHLVDLQIRNRPQIAAYRLWGQRTLNDAYGDPTNSKVVGTGSVQMLEVTSGQTFRSNTIIQKGLGLMDENLRGTTRIVFDPDDFVGDVLTTLPPDDDVLYVRLQERPLTKTAFNVVANGLVNAGSPILGPIYIVPPARFFGMVGSPISVDGKAPANTGSVIGKVPQVTPDGQVPNPMHVVLPRHCRNFRILNRSIDTVLLLSFGLGDSLSTLGPGQESMLYGNIKEVVLASVDNSGANAKSVEFSIQAIVSLGEGI